MLDEGYKTTTLYTDLANPTSNKIYQEIGYEQLRNLLITNFLINFIRCRIR
jgi:predicted GNAT family acetyltransferase